MRPSRRGIALVGILWFVAFILAMSLALSSVINGARSRVEAHKREQAAEAMAASGVEYALACARKGHPVVSFTSPDLDGGGWFEIVRVQGRVVSIGHFGASEARREVSAR